jgi:hypothetical protein
MPKWNCPKQESHRTGNTKATFVVAKQLQIRKKIVTLQGQEAKKEKVNNQKAEQI